MQPNRMRPYGRLAWFVTLALSAQAMAATWYVSANGSPAGDGTSWETALDTIQAGIDASTNGDLVEIADGLYSGDGNRDISFQGKAITVRSSNGPKACVMDCDGQYQDKHRGFSFESGEGNDSVLEGITIFQGHDISGGGLSLDGASPIIRHCIIVDNIASMSGGGIYCTNASSPLISNCIILGNRSDKGGAISCYSGSCPTIVNCTIAGNHAEWRASGLYCYYDSSPEFINSIIWGDAEDDTPLIVNENNSEPAFQYCDIDGGWTGEGNITAAPQFSFNGADLHLQSGSPCIDAGSNDSGDASVLVDLDGNSRILYDTIDIGAYEYNSSEPPAMAISSTSVRVVSRPGEESSLQTTIQLKNRASGTLSWVAQTQATWLQITPSTGQSSGEVNNITLSIDPTGLPGGHYSTEIWIEDASSSEWLTTVFVDFHWGTDRIVHADGSGEYPTIQAAINAASHGDRIICKPGTYSGDGNTDISCLGKEILLLGEQGAKKTIINGPVDTGYSDTKRRVFLFNNHETSSTIVDGFTLTGQDCYGSAIQCGYSSPTIRNCIIRNNTIKGKPGRPGQIYDPDPEGIVSVSHASPSISNTVIADNEQSHSCVSEIYCYGYGTPSLTNCTISTSKVVPSSDPDIEETIIRAESNSNPIITNTILWGHGMGSDPVFIMQDETSSINITWSCVEGGWNGQGNITEEPNFAFPSIYYLAPDSPCVDTGTDDPTVDIPETDLDGIQRPMDGNGDGIAITDMGAHEIDSEKPLLVLNTTEIYLHSAEGNHYPSSQAVLLRNCGGAISHWQITDKPDWVSISPSSGDMLHETALIYMTADSTGLALGTYSGVISLADPQAHNSPLKINITLTVGRTLNVPGNYPAIQDAMDDALDGDFVIIADGIYTGERNRDLDTDGKAIWIRSESGIPERCIIDCQNMGRGFCFHSREKLDTTVEGITIVRGHARLNDSFSGHGGAVYCRYTSPSLINCIFKNNVAEANGGAVYGFAGSYESASLLNCQFYGNCAEKGAALYSTNNTKINHCTFCDNTAEYGGGAIHHYYGYPVLTNSVMWGNYPYELFFDSALPQVSWCNIRNGSGADWFGVGCIDENPLFAFPDDLRLSADSPCIDAGSPFGLDTFLLKDAEAVDRILDGDGDGSAVTDMGAFEYSPSSSRIALNQTRMTFDAVVGGNAPQNQQLSIRNCGGNTLNWTISNQPDWVIPSSTNGVTGPEANSINIGVDISTLPRGLHTAVLFISDPSAVNSPRKLSIELLLKGPIFVPEDYATIQEAIDAAIPGEVIEIADGTYTGEGNKNLDFVGKEIRVRSASGDPALCIIDCEEDGRGFYFHTYEEQDTTIVGLTVTNGLVDENSPGGQYGGAVLCENSSVTFTQCVFQDNTAGYGGGACNNGGSLTLQQCVFTENSSTTGGGGGLYNRNNCNSAVLECVFESNSAHSSGGGSFNSQSNGHYRQCIFQNNHADRSGGGAYIYDGDPGWTFTDCDFSSNSVENKGGGIYNSSSDTVIHNCSFADNSANEHAGAMYIGYSSPRISLCDFQNNQTAGYGGSIYFERSDQSFIFNSKFLGNTAVRGGGIYVQEGSTWTPGSNPELSNCVFSGNVAPSGGGIYVGTISHPVVNSCTFSDNSSGIYASRLITLSNSIVWGNNAYELSSDPQGYYDISNCCIRGGFHGNNILVSNPRFIDADGPDNIAGTSDDDLRLEASSLCNDAGSNGILPVDILDMNSNGDTSESLPIDLEGNQRIVGNVDFGAYEHTEPNPDQAPSRIYVNQNAPAGGDGITWETAMKHLQDALDLAEAGTEIWVAVGTYYPDTSTRNPGGSGDRNATFYLSNGMSIHGGFLGNETSLEERRPDPDPLYADPAVDTVLNGNIGLTNDRRDNSSSLITCSYTTLNTALSCVTITESCRGMSNTLSYPTVEQCTFCNNHYDESASGVMRGGAAMFNNWSCPTISQCTFSENHASEGGAVYGMGSSPEITDCLFIDNSAQSWGGGLLNDCDSNAKILRCRFIDNAANYRGAGLLNVNYCNPVLIDCLFQNNRLQSSNGKGAGVSNMTSNSILINCTFSKNETTSQTGSGGALSNEQSHPVLINCVFHKNRAIYHGGAIFNSDSSDAFLSNCLFMANSAYGSNAAGGGIYNEDSLLTLSNCIFREDSPESIGCSDETELNVSYSNIQGGTQQPWFGIGCMDADPLFVDPDGLDDDPDTVEDNDYRLSTDSPCIDAGDNDTIQPDTFDLDQDGDTEEPIPFDLADAMRFVDDPITQDTGNGTPPVVDIGPFEFQLITGDLDGDRDVDLEDYVIFSDCLSSPAAILYGDTDSDGDVDLEDYITWQACLAGPALSLEIPCQNMDWDSDADVDLADFAIFQAHFSRIESPLPTTCQLADFNLDNDVDLQDFSIFQQSFGMTE